MKMDIRLKSMQGRPLENSLAGSAQVGVGQSGFTLVEAAIKLLLVGLIATIAILQITDDGEEALEGTEQEQLAAAFELARAEAIKLGTQVVVCPFDRKYDPNSCSRTENWSDGWMVITEGSSNNLMSKTVLRRQSNTSTYNIVASLSEASPKIVFQATGRPSQTGSLIFCDPVDSAKSEAVALDISGHTTRGWNASACN